MAAFKFSDLAKMATRAAENLKKLKKEADQIRAEQRMLASAEKKLLERGSQPGVAAARQKIDISTSSVAWGTIVIFGLAALAWFLMQISSILILFFIAGFVAMLINPIVDSWQRFGVPRAVSVLIIYIVFLALVGLVLAALIPILTREIPNIANQVLAAVQQYVPVDTSFVRAQLFEFQSYLSDIQKNLSQENIAAGFDFISAISKNASAILVSVAGGVFNFVLVLVIAFFMLLEENGMKRFMLALLPSRYHAYAAEKISVVEDKFGHWIRGQLLLMLAMFVISYICLSILGIDYALSLALLSGFAELLPIVGPLMAYIPAVIIALSQDGLTMALIVTALYIGFQQLEGNVLVPLIMKRAVGLSPVVVMFAMFVGASFPAYINPIVGIILAVPVATAISVFIMEYADKKK